MQLPPHFIVDGGPAWFKDWVVNGALNNSDAVVTISAAVAAEVRDFIQSEPGLRRRPRVGFWHLGSDIGAKPSTEQSQEPLRAIGPKPYLLVVGTIEPRKSHDLTLSAMERLWTEGSELELCIAARRAGWSTN
jgi:glycosyltransferase involved in cell wall biosynthesis